MVAEPLAGMLCVTAADFEAGLLYVWLAYVEAAMAAAAAALADADLATIGLRVGAAT